MMDIVWEQKKKRIPKVNYRALEARGRNISARRLLLHKFIYKKEVNVQNINHISLELRDILKNRWVTTMIE
jgi:hypothetical protein